MKCPSTEQRASRICFGVPSPSYQSSASIAYTWVAWLLGVIC
eukprot:SAG31_NODE_40124_length_283_cov_0.739130_1_plen_41_part_10